MPHNRAFEPCYEPCYFPCIRARKCLFTRLVFPLRRDARPTRSGHPIRITARRNTKRAFQGARALDAVATCDRSRDRLACRLHQPAGPDACPCLFHAQFAVTENARHGDANSRLRGEPCRCGHRVAFAGRVIVCRFARKNFHSKISCKFNRLTRRIRAFVPCRFPCMRACIARAWVDRSARKKFTCYRPDSPGKLRRSRNRNRR